MANAVPAPVRSQQKLLRMTIAKLKHLSTLTLRFDDKRLVGLMGPNGCGKTTVLHALACSFIPTTSDEGYRFPRFFLPTSDSTWNGSEFDLLHQFGINGQLITETRTYRKTTDRWTPRTFSRPIRPLKYIKISESIPVIETFNSMSLASYQQAQTALPNAAQILADLSFVMNRQYTAIHEAQITSSYQRNRNLQRVTYQGTTYANFAMSAGEQRVLRILIAARSLPRYGLLLIDELDLFLHPHALSRLVDRLDLIADPKNLQIVFTCHAPHLWESASKCNIYQLWQAGGQTLLIEGQHPDSVLRLTGQQVRPLQLYCEDNVARAILRKVLEQLSVERYCEITCFGSASNAFTIAASVVLENKPIDDLRIVLDGDVMNSAQERINRIGQVLSGNSQPDIDRRARANSMILSFNHGASPESFLIENGNQPGGVEEINTLLMELGVLNNPHDVIHELARRLGDTEDQCLRRLVDNASLSPNWNGFVEGIYTFVAARKAALAL